MNCCSMAAHSFADKRPDFSVQLDTGSSDLWVYAPDADIKVTNDSHLTTNITYGIGSVSGPIQFAELIVGEFTIPSQGRCLHVTLSTSLLTITMSSFRQCQQGIFISAVLLFLF